MAIINAYIAYLKDNPNGYWFKRKIYGWGWTPARWQAWAAILAFVAFIVWNGVSLPAAPDAVEIEWFMGKTLLAVVLLIVLCYFKGEKPRWQWGFPKKEN